VPSVECTGKPSVVRQAANIVLSPKN